MSNKQGNEYSEYYDKVEPNLRAIAEYKSRNLSNEMISDRLGVLYQDFQIFVKQFKDLRDALTVGEDMIVDKAESKLYEQAFKYGNVTALKYILSKRSPDRWGDKSEDNHNDLPTINIEIKDASLKQDELDEIVSDMPQMQRAKADVS